MSRRPDTIDQLAAARPAGLRPPATDTAAAVAAITAHSAPIDAPGRRRRPLLAVVASAGLTAAAAVTAIALATSGGGPAVVPQTPDGPPAQALTAGQILLAAADRSGAATTGDGRYLVLRAEFGHAMPIMVGKDHRYTMLSHQTAETWLSRSGSDPHWSVAQQQGLTPASPADEAAWRAQGSPAEVLTAKPTPGGLKGSSKVSTRPGERQSEAFDGPHVYAIGEDNVSVADLEKLPTEPAALREELLSHYRGGGGDLPTDRDEWLLTIGSSVVVGLPVSGPVRAAAYRMLAGLPGARALGEVRDQRGRAGQAVAFVQDRDISGRVEERLIIDAATGRALGRELRVLEPAGATAWARPGSLLTYETILGVEATDDNPPA